MENNSAVINVSYGSFNVVECENGSNLFYGDTKVFHCECPWWDKDGITDLLMKYEELVKSKMHCTDTFEINKDNVKEVIVKANNVLSEVITDKQIKGFICSRLTQVINKMNSENM